MSNRPSLVATSNSNRNYPDSRVSHFLHSYSADYCSIVIVFHHSLDNERLRHAFAEKANTVGPWLESQLEQVVQIGLGGRGSLEQAIRRLQEIYNQVYI